jgi:release factor glutamine methyltransferase
MIWKNNLLIELRAIYLEKLSKTFSRGEGKQMIDTLIKSFFDVSQIQLALQPEYRLSESEMIRLHLAVKKLLNHVPLQYITGESQFLDLALTVDESVLIPRPETEELANLIISREKAFGLKVLDICTGSGCIALVLKKHLKNPDVVAIDISEKALELAKYNSDKNKLDVDFMLIDILDKNAHASIGQFDVVASNPPYVTKSDKQNMQKNVLDYEPHKALFVVDERPILFYEVILEYCLTNLKAGGRIYFEINENYGEEILGLFDKYAFQQGELHKDIHGKYRIAAATLKA